MVSYAFKENPPSKQRYLKRLDINVHSKLVPGISPDTVRDESCEEAVEVEEEEQHEDSGNDELDQPDPN